MSILLILSYFDPFYGPKVFKSIPIEISEQKEKEIVYFINVPSENRFIETISMGDKQKIINLPFTIHSDWARGYKELLLISVILDKNYKSEIFEKTIRELVDRLKNTPDIYKAFYKDQENFSLDPDIDEIQSILKDILLKDGYQQLNQDLKEVSLGNFLILGLAKVGKTSILENLRN
jgi:sugar-specific transcriptional regulator TrmB